MSIIYIAQTVLIGLTVGLVLKWLDGRFFKHRQDFAAATKTAALHDNADAQIPAARVALTLPPTEGVGWLSHEVIDLPLDSNPGISYTRFPGYDRAIYASMPFYCYERAFVKSLMSFDLIGTHHTRTRISSIQAVIDGRFPVPAGTVYFASPQGTGSKESFAFDLASTDLHARIQDDHGLPTPEWFVNAKTTDLIRGETVGFIVEVFAPLFTDDIHYHLEIAFDTGPTVAIYDHRGAPFRMIGYPTTAQRAYFATSPQHELWPNYPNTIR
ncbi:Uncharacterised protein [Mycobacteroides abscessus subsp. bolletii]|nr:Uncharacterised protein [Mycobacteroides abscessus subsp. bolletii]SKG54842.1 Uncharacterised protein [Mycobacteroides abscessus subsp. bolletii]SKG85162.1 Uncharacterised protein [Mycobacteroides abscessus subsp. bolletii]SKG92610.1 Uncharacterised protein [Mycobacteroides abscessus subsp. bolletii]SKH27921.1 Uncharacterised protein [Mycobacteroides abscessus subsp. bolletii]